MLYVAVGNVHFFARNLKGKMRMCIIHGWYQKYLVSVLVFCNYLFCKTYCTIICPKINAKIPL